MSANPNQVIVTSDECLCATARVSALHAHHRDFPEIRAEGETVEAVTLKLTARLCHELQSVPDQWHRQCIEQAIADVQAFALQPH